jgi:hypothetical protein
LESASGDPESLAPDGYQYQRSSSSCWLDRSLVHHSAEHPSSVTITVVKK